MWDWDAGGEPLHTVTKYPSPLWPTAATDGPTLARVEKIMRRTINESSKLDREIRNQADN
jgi:hypothetical protein